MLRLEVSHRRGPGPVAATAVPPVSSQGVELAAYLSSRDDAARAELAGAIGRFEASQERTNARLDAFQEQTNARFASVDAKFAAVEADLSELKGQVSSATTTLSLTVAMVGALIAGAMLFTSMEARRREPRGEG